MNIGATRGAAASGAWTTGGGLSAISRIGASLRVREVGPQSTAPQGADSATLTELREKLLDLAKAASTLAEQEANVGIRRQVRSAQVTGSLALTTQSEPGTQATLTSSEEVNRGMTSPSISTETPSWSGIAIWGPRVGGTYDGSSGDTQLTFEVTSLGFFLNPTIEVRDSDGTQVDELNFSPFAWNQTRELSNGLSVTLTSPIGIVGDSFSIDVAAPRPAEVDPDAALGDAAFEAGEQVRDGSFKVNGTTIAVSERDTIQDVLDRVNASEAGVTARFDGTSEAVVLKSDEASSSAQIRLGADTSGFLSAVKLDDGALQEGTDGIEIAESSSDAIADLQALSAVEAGALTIGDQEIAIDPEEDSVEGVLERIEEETGLRATLEADGDVRLRGRGRRAVKVSSDGTGLLGALGIEAGVYRAKSGPSQRRVSNERAVREAVVGVRDALEAFASEGSALPEDLASSVHSVLGSALAELFGGESDAGKLRSGLGLDLSRATETGTRTLDIDIDALVQGLRTTRATDLLFGTEEQDGLGTALLNATRTALESVDGQLAAAFDTEAGVGFDAYA